MNIPLIGSAQHYAPSAMLQRLIGVGTKGQSSPPSGSNCTEEISIEGHTKLNTAKEIMSRYDVHNISYNDLRHLGQELFDAGIVSEEEALQLSAPTFLPISVPGSNLSGPLNNIDVPRDYVLLYEQLVGSGCVKNGIELATHTLSLFRDLATLQQRK